MNRIRLAASLMALAPLMLSGVALAQEANAPFQMAQAEELPPAVAELLYDNRPPEAFSDSELRRRMITARNYMQDMQLPRDARGALSQIARESRAELIARNANPGQSSVGAGQPAFEDDAQDGPDFAQPDEPVPGGEYVDVTALLNDTRAAEDLTDSQLKQRLSRARAAMDDPDLNRKQRRAVQELARETRLELLRRQEATKQRSKAASAAEQEQLAKPAKPAAKPVAKPANPPPAPSEQAAAKPAAPKPAPSTAPVPDEVMAYLNDVRPPNELTREELAARIAAGRKFSADPTLPPATREEVSAALKNARAEQLLREGEENQKAEPPKPVVETPQPEQPKPAESKPAQPPSTEANATPQQGEAPSKPAAAILEPEEPDSPALALQTKADTYLADKQPASSYSTEELRKRVGEMRELLASDKLPAETEKALRAKLRAERDLLRSRVRDTGDIATGTAPDGEAQADGERQASADQPATEKPANEPAKPAAGDSKSPPSPQEIETVLNDTRPATALDERDLRRRIDVSREAWRNDKYPEAERNRWRDRLAQDRLALRDRLMDDRRRRAEKLRQEKDEGDLNINIGIVFQPGLPPPPREVFVEEVDEDYIEDALVAPPRRPIPRRYSVSEVEELPDLRDAVTRIEVDTIRFGFGESFLREEEIEKLDRIGTVIERILAAHPREVFLIEGHTDAVGTDAANLSLSRERAQAVKDALSTYYEIPAMNLKAVGYGERFLLIPTDEPEAENRRVSVARATPLLGELPAY